MAHVDLAGALPGVTAARGDARSLVEADASVDAVLLLGPLYHLPDRAGRLNAWREAARVVRPGGVVAAATISRYAAALDGFVRDFYRRPGYRQLVTETFATGRHSPPPGSGWFTTAYFHEPMEARAEAEEAGLSVERVASVEGPLWTVGRLAEALADDAEREQALDFPRRTEDDPHLLAASSHLLTVARRP